MKKIIIARRVGADVYSLTKEKRFHLLESYPNPLGREKNSELQYDKPGSSKGKFMGASPHSLDGEKNPHDEVMEQFAKELSHSLIRDLNEDHELCFMIVAEPRLLGKLRGQFEDLKVSHRLEWVEKDLDKIPQEKWCDLLGIENYSSFQRSPM